MTGFCLLQMSFAQICVFLSAASIYVYMYLSFSTFSFIQHACKTAGVLFRVLELLSKDVQLPSEVYKLITKIYNTAFVLRL